MRLFLVLLYSLGHFLAIAQNTQTYTHDNYLFRTAQELYGKEKYTAARQYFEKYLSLNKQDLLSVESEYYLADCGLQLFHDDAELKLNEFVKKYPAHPKSQQALLSLGNVLKGKKDYKSALLYYEKLNSDLLSKEQKEEVHFNMGYCYLNDKQLDKALPHFNSLKTGENKYTYAASYYAGNIEFKQGDNDAALTDYKKAEQNESYRALVPYMIAHILYKQKKYEDLIAYNDTLAKQKTDFKNQDDIQLLLSDVYFRKQEHLKCVNASEKYAATKELPEDAQYRYAKSYYYLGKNEKAIANFKKLVAQKDSIGQHAAYFLALSYLRDDNKTFALPFLAQAAELPFSKEVKEESIFLQGKISYELGKFSEVIASLKEYRKRYPKGRFVQEANEIMSDALLNTSHYSEALDYIESLSKRSPRIDAVYQKAAYHRAEELYNQNHADSSVSYFEISQQYPYDKVLVAGANYWIGEILSMKGDYKGAVEYYLATQENKQSGAQDFYKKADYGLGYAFYNQKMYDKASTRFREFSDRRDQQHSKYYPDALLRLADCYYVQKRYTDALITYDKALEAQNKEKDYILLQKGLVSGTLGNYDQADNFLFDLTHQYPKSPYYETALFNKAMFALERGDYLTAVQSYTMFIRERPGSPYLPYALERRAICNVNLKNPELAYTDYQLVLKDYPTSPVANAALQGIQEIMSKEGKNEEFIAILKEYKTANPQKTDLEHIEFESGKRLYFDQKYNEAIQVLSNFQISYPNSSFGYESTYYLADAYYRLGKLNEALPYYQKVVEANKGTYTNRSLFKIADIYYATGNYSEAKKYNKQLQKVASSKKEVANAYQGLMLAHFQTAQYDSCFAYGELIVNSGYATTTGQNKAFLYQAKSLLAQKDTLKALDYFVVTMNEAKDENGAEAQYTIATIFYQQKKYKSSLNELFNLNEYYSDYVKWVDQSFLLVADNYLALGETFQAKATLESIVKNASDAKMVESAKQRLDKMAQENAGVNQ
ncbi:MAG TPA: hypothetical protein DCR46_00495 [Cytophagales bacterium]|nr:hypothetical protein [Cytophagales bacterium]